MGAARAAPAGAVLCGGASHRMGRDKALLAIDGVPMAERVARTLDGAGCRPVWLVGGDAGRLGLLGRRLLPDVAPGAGPVGGVITALRAAPSGVLVSACDLVDLDTGTVGSVIGDGTSKRPRVAHTGRIEPLLTWWPAVVLADVERCFDRGVRAVHEVLEEIGFDAVVADRSRLRNANTPQDLAVRNAPGRDVPPRSSPPS